MRNLEEREKIVKEWRASGQCMADWCQEHDVTKRTLEGYRYRVGNVHKQNEYSEKFEPPNQVCVVPVNPNLSIRFDS